MRLTYALAKRDGTWSVVAQKDSFLRRSSAAAFTPPVRAPQPARRSDSSPRFSALPILSNYCWKTGGGPLTRFHFRLTFTSTRLAIFMKGMPLFMP